MQFVDLESQQNRIRADLDRRIEAVLAHGRYILGPEVQELEEHLATYVGVGHCVAVANGTDALMLAMLAVGVRAGDEVITTPFTFIATGEMISLLGARPVFVDIDKRTYNIDPTKIENAITNRTRAIVPVSLYGQCADFDEINAIAFRHGLPVIEDGAQSFGATYKGRQSCGLCTVATTSFFPSKPLGCYGDGGALFTDDPEIAAILRQLRAHGQDRRYHHPLIGMNSRMDTIQAAVILAKMAIFNDEIKRRQQVAHGYSAQLKDLVMTPLIHEANSSVFAQYTIRVEDRQKVQSALRHAGIPTVVHYPVPLYRQPAFSYLSIDPAKFSHSEKAAAEVISLPMHPYLSHVEQEEVIAAIKNVLNEP